jgi:hypothetical protein
LYPQIGQVLFLGIFTSKGALGFALKYKMNRKWIHMIAPQYLCFTIWPVQPAASRSPAQIACPAHV